MSSNLTWRLKPYFFLFFYSCEEDYEYAIFFRGHILVGNCGFRPGKGMEVFQNLQKFRVRVWKSDRFSRKFRGFV